MRLLILSDLHLEVRPGNAPVFNLAASRPDVVILAGDIAPGGVGAVEWAARTFAPLPVLYVAGNHEAYGHCLEEVDTAIARACAATSNVRFLQCGEHLMAGTGGTVRFLGATLWTDFDLYGEENREAAMGQARRVMTDYRRIRVAAPEQRLLDAEDTVRLHAGHKTWLAARLAEPFDGKTVVITHMAPTFRSVAARYADDVTSAAFASRLDGLVAQADLWVHGHMHDSCDYTVGNARVVCNPCGYVKRSGANENPAFDLGLVVEV